MSFTRQQIEQTLAVNELVDMEWNFGGLMNRSCSLPDAMQ